MKCIVKDCPNHTHEGKFIHDLCAPCHEFITRGEGKHSQAYRNSMKLVFVVLKDIQDKITDLMIINGE